MKRLNTNARNLVFQYYVGNIPAWAKASATLCSNYAKKFGVEHQFHTDSKFSDNPYYESLRLLYDESFDEYDHILYLDADIAPNTKENIFDYTVADVGAVLDRHSADFDVNNPKEQQLFDNMGLFYFESNAADIWVAKYGERARPRPSKSDPGMVRQINSGVMLWSREGRIRARKEFLDYKEYMSLDFGSKQFEEFQKLDQAYYNCMFNLLDFDVTELPRKFNNHRWKLGMQDDCFMHYTEDYKGKSKRMLMEHLK